MTVTARSIALCCAAAALVLSLNLRLRAAELDAPGVLTEAEGQLPGEMHVRMDELPRIRVGIDEGGIRGSDNRALQAAVDYIAALGGGTVEMNEIAGRGWASKR